MERKSERGGKIKKEGKRRRRAKAGETEPATTISVAEEATTASAGDNGACSDGGCGENKCSSIERIGDWEWTECRRPSQTGPFCNGNRLREELLCMRGFWAYGPSLQESGAERKSRG